MPIDYSNWKKIDVSDDEDETYKHIDTPSLFHWRHQSRLEKMVEEKKRRESLKRKRDGVQKSMDDLRKRMEEFAVLDSVEREKLEQQMAELKKSDQEYEKEQKEFEKKSLTKPWNVDTIGRTGFNQTRINRTSSPSSEKKSLLPLEDPKRKLEEFFVSNQWLIKMYGSLNSLDETERFLLEHPALCCDEMATCLASFCMQLEMEDKRDEMRRMAYQLTVMNYLLEMAPHLKCPPGNPNLTRTIIARMKNANQAKKDALEADVKTLVDLVVEQVSEKKAEYWEKKRVDEERQKKEQEEKRMKRLGPGGLDPIEVLETLPEGMRRCFENRDLAALERLVLEMPPNEFEQHFQRCIDSGLWIQNSDKKDVQEKEP